MLPFGKSAIGKSASNGRHVAYELPKADDEIVNVLSKR